MWITSILSLLLILPVILAQPILGSAGGASYADASVNGGDAVATATAVAGGGVASASASSSASAAVSDQYGPIQNIPILQNTQNVQHVPVVQNIQTVQQVPVVQNYQTVQHVPIVQQQFIPSTYGSGIGGYGVGADGAIGGGFGGGLNRFHESYTFRGRGFGGGLGHGGFGGGRYKVRYSSGGAGGFAGIGGIAGAGVIGGGGVSFLG